MRFELELEIARPPATVFDYMTDQSHAPNWVRGLVAAKTPPPAVGSGVRWVQRTSAMGRSFDVSIECTAFERPRRFALRTIAPFRSGQEMTLTGTPTGTHLSVRGGGELSGFFRAAGPVLQAFYVRKFRQDFQRLKQALEAQSPAELEATI